MSYSITEIKLLTEHEVSALIRKSVHWLRRKRWEGGDNSIPYRKLGSSVRYAEIDVLNWIQQHALLTSTSEGDTLCN
jgi:predicted DNA-binding transcriptional regulator AlpA